jgi:cytochrome c biogenesis protein CcmG/thiol:disulfide interchange protein DsbE
VPILPENETTRRQLLALSPLLALLLLSAFLATGLLDTEPRVKESRIIGFDITDFDVKSLTSEDSFSPALWKNKIVVLNIFASWCKPCLVEHPVLMRLSQTGKVEMLGLAWRDTPENAAQWLNKHGNPFHHVGVDPGGKSSFALALTGVPETYVIDQYGKIAYHYKSAVTDEIVDEIILPMVQKLRNTNAPASRR